MIFQQLLNPAWVTVIPIAIDVSLYNAANDVVTGSHL